MSVVVVCCLLLVYLWALPAEALAKVGDDSEFFFVNVHLHIWNLIFGIWNLEFRILFFGRALPLGRLFVFGKGIIC